MSTTKYSFERDNKLRAWMLFLVLIANVSAFNGHSQTGLRTPGGLLATVPSLENSRTRRGNVGSLTRLSYGGADEDVSATSSIQHIPAVGHFSWWKQEQPKSQQANVDDYLEFLDRRYHRLNKDEDEQRQETRLSVLKWLTHGYEDGQESLNASKDDENAFYVLGVAGLASQELLRKHHIPVDGSKKSPLVVAHTTSIVDAEVEDSKASNNKVAALFKPFANPRERLLKFQDSKLRAVGLAILKTLKGCPDKLLRLSGGRKSVSFTLGAVTTLAFLLARPLVATFLGEGTRA
jgi:hypothetical protein